MDGQLMTFCRRVRVTLLTITLFFQTNCTQSIEREVVENVRADTTEESIDQSEHGRCAQDAAVACDPAVPGRRRAARAAARRRRARGPERPRAARARRQALMIHAQTPTCRLRAFTEPV